MTNSGSDQEIPTIESSVLAIRELIELWKQQHVNGSVEIPILEKSPLTGVAIHIMAEHSVALSESILLLTSAKMYLECSPLIRLTMECAVTAAWLTISPNAANAARHEHARSRLATMRSIFEDMDYQDKDLLDETVAEVGQLSDHKSEAARYFERRCREISGGEKIYSLYRMISEFSHAGIGLADLYLQESEVTKANPYGVSFRDSPFFSYHDAALVEQVMMLALSLRAWDDIVPAHPMRSLLNSVAGSFGFSLEISRSSAS